MLPRPALEPAHKTKSLCASFSNFAHVLGFSLKFFKVFLGSYGEKIHSTDECQFEI